MAKVRTKARRKWSPSKTLTNGALIHVLVAGPSHKASRAGANGSAIQGVGVADRPLVTGVTNTGVIEVAQKT